MKTTLVIMAAGIGSRFGGGIKQLAPVGPGGQIIMDYSIHDAIAAGFNKIVFIIRKDIENDFREIIGNRIEKLCAEKNVEVAYTFQALDDLPAGVQLPPQRKKPWGTGQAVLTCKGIVKEPFAVINADDYYGQEAFRIVHDFLLQYTPDAPNRYCMAGFILKNTLSDNGGVTRGISKTDENGYLTQVDETSNIVKTADGAAADGRVLDPESYVSMNFWGLTPEFIDKLEEGFCQFFRFSGHVSDMYTNHRCCPCRLKELFRRHCHLSAVIFQLSGKAVSCSGSFPLPFENCITDKLIIQLSLPDVEIDCF